MHGRVRVAPSPVPHPDLDVLRAAALQLAEWSGLVGHLHELMSGLSGCLWRPHVGECRGSDRGARGKGRFGRRRGRDVPPLRNAGGYLIYRIGGRPEMVAEGNIPIKTIDFIDNRFYGDRMGHLQPLVTRRYADFGMHCSAICHPAGVAHR